MIEINDEMVNIDNNTMLDTLMSVYKHNKLKEKESASIGNAILILEALKDVELLEKDSDVLTTCKNLKRYIGYAWLQIQSAKQHFDEVDTKMAQVKEGSTVYEEDAIDLGFSKGYPKKIIKILDKELGIIETYEKSIDKTETKCITEYQV